MKVKVGQGSCGIATGAKKVADSIDAMIKRDNLDVDLEVTGCVGTCFLEPIVDVYDNEDRKSTRLNSSHVTISYAVFCLKKKIISTQIGRTHI